MGWLDVLRRRAFGAPLGEEARTSGTDPASLTTLWAVVDSLPDPYEAAADPEGLDAVVDGVGPDCARLLRELDVATAMLDTPAHAAHVRPYPWRGPGQPFSPRRFGLARERAALTGPTSFAGVLREPGRMATIDTGPEPTALDIVDDRLPWPLRAMIQDVARERGHLADELDPAMLDYPEPRWTELPRKHDFSADDPEHPGLEVSTKVVADLAAVTVELTADMRAAYRETEAVHRLMGEEISPAEALGKDAATRANAALWDGLGRPVRITGHSTGYGSTTLMVCVELDERWTAPVFSLDRVRVGVDTAYVVSLPARERVRVLTSVIAHAALTALTEHARLRSAFVRLRDLHARTLPDHAAAELGIDR
ncbi:hypothetical protein [Georgenia deserti]|uniref:Uncharacterized protein n=1 Tax=Georgenia deserti TaxID=2093781 RepID=A0ABW4L0Z3_9MICO